MSKGYPRKIADGWYAHRGGRLYLNRGDGRESTYVESVEIVGDVIEVEVTVDEEVGCELMTIPLAVIKDALIKELMGYDEG